jgi:RND superfamily putative drug exporter
MVAVFQEGFLGSILPFQQTPIIDAWIPLFLFTVLFGLSMDYHVFLLSRVREHYDITGDNRASVAYGLRSTAGLITGAALIMVAVFAGFASGDAVPNQQNGFGLGVAVLIGRDHRAFDHGPRDDAVAGQGQLVFPELPPVDTSYRHRG